MGHREADSFAQHIIRYVSPIMGSGFGIEPLLEGIPSELGCDFLHLLAEGFPFFEVIGGDPLNFRLRPTGIVGNLGDKAEALALPFSIGGGA